MSPNPHIPYGPAPAWCFPVFECSTYVLFIICLLHAVRKNKPGVIYLSGGLAFGLILEYIEVISGMGYKYGEFWVMFGKAPLDIPLCIGIGWGIIMYSARLFSDGLKLGLWACAALDTLLALNIDLSMDTVAYRMHMWTWDWSGTSLNPLTANWFGIPWGNFFGWETVIFCYSLFSRLFERLFTGNAKAAIYKYILVAVLALLCSEVILYVSEVYVEDFLYKNLGINSFHRFAGTAIIMLLVVLWGWRKRKPKAADVPGVAWWVPGWFHFYFFAGLFICGFYLENAWMTIAACINLLIGIAVHVYPYLLKKQLS